MLRLTWCDCGRTAYLYTLENGRSTATVDPCASCGTRADEFDCAWGTPGRALLEAQASTFIGDMQPDPTLVFAAPRYANGTIMWPLTVSFPHARPMFSSVIDRERDRAAERDDREEAFFEACRRTTKRVDQ